MPPLSLSFSISMHALLLALGACTCSSRRARAARRLLPLLPPPTPQRPTPLLFPALLTPLCVVLAAACRLLVRVAASLSQRQTSSLGRARSPPTCQVCACGGPPRCAACIACRTSSLPPLWRSTLLLAHVGFVLLLPALNAHALLLPSCCRMHCQPTSTTWPNWLETLALSRVLGWAPCRRVAVFLGALSSGRWCSLARLSVPRWSLEVRTRVRPDTFLVAAAPLHVSLSAHPPCLPLLLIAAMSPRTHTHTGHNLQVPGRRGRTRRQRCTQHGGAGRHRPAGCLMRLVCVLWG